ncbi:MAG: hydroxyacid dehydrogenase, partial [Proteobacteria bacterium]|nr:hydroxyacid dehydrogenase [Pseudomonadota bacterium]
GGNTLALVERHIPDSKIPFEESYPWYVLIEASVEGSPDVLVNALAHCLDKGLLLDAVVAKSKAEAARLWRLRHSIAEAEKREGVALKHDISVPIGRMEEFLARAEKLLREAFPESEQFVFGHVGDGNLHYNVHLQRASGDSEYEQKKARITALVYDLVAEFGGSFSAEHGIGSLKREFLSRYKDDTDLQLMRGMKKTLDPANILNPGKVI